MKITRRIKILLILVCVLIVLVIPWSPLAPYKIETPTMIPSIIHQSWKTATIPTKFEKWRRSWIYFHPTWTHTLWTDDDNLNLVKTHVPWFLETYNALPKNINRADAARYVYLHVHGGFYADLDVECLKSHSDLRLHSIVLGQLSSDDSFEHNIPNAWMASLPNHPFWTFVLRKIQDALKESRSVEALTGPILLFEAIRDFEFGVERFTVLPAGSIH